MIARLGPNNILHTRASSVCSNVNYSNKHSWFAHIGSLLHQYGLPQPLQILSNHPSKGSWKAMVRKAVSTFWHQKLTAEAADLPSLSLLRASHLSLTHCHPLWTTCPSGPLPTKQASLMARILSGRYQSCWLRRHWDHTDGCCRLPGCGAPRGDTLHIFTGQCPALQSASMLAKQKWIIATDSIPFMLEFVNELMVRNPTNFLEFVSDPSTDSPTIALAQTYGTAIWSTVFHMARTWLYLHHQERLKLLGLHQFLL